MAYKLHKFDNVLLPVFDASGDTGTGQVDPSLLDSIGGVYDYYGTNQRLPRRQIHQISGTYLGETDYIVDHSGNRIVDHLGNYIIAGLGPNRLQAQLDAITRKQGVRGTLWRIRQEDDVLQWKTARCLQVQRPSQVTDVMRLANCTCVFETQMAAWRAEDKTTVSNLLNNGLNGMNVHNGGVMAVRDVVITLTANGTMASFSLVGANYGVSLSYSGTLQSGDNLVIDTGAQTVKVNGVNAYSSFSRGSAHTVQGWCPLPAGTTVFNVTMGGAQGTLKFEFYEQYS